MRSMLVAPSGDRLLVELKAVDGAWPLIGAASFAPAVTLVPGTIAAEPLVFSRLNLAPGARMQLGRGSFVLAAAVTMSRIGVVQSLDPGPRVLMRIEDLPQTALIQPGAIVDYQMHAVLPAGSDVKGAIAALRAAFPESGWRIRDSANAAPGVTQFLDAPACS